MNKKTDKRALARITGWSLILMALIAGFSIGYAFPEFNKPNQTYFVKDNILNNWGLYRNMLIGILVILLLDFLISYTLYKFFREYNPNISLTSGILRFLYTIVFGIAAFYLYQNLNGTELTNQTINTNIRLFQSIWNGGLIIFGLHLTLIGVLMKSHPKIPKTLWYLVLIAGVSYVIVHFLKLVSPDLEFINTLAMMLALPMAIGELSLAVWLLAKGGKDFRE
ncbi:MAG: DUF4386 domain-containing protein [Saprospiraceae bacterium]